jgi:glycosyltransferase involved in cell wall biosynthesis
MQMLLECFDDITKYIPENRAYYRGWKSNLKHKEQAFRVQMTHFIVPRITSYYSNAPSVTWESMKKLQDYDKVSSRVTQYGQVEAFAIALAEAAACGVPTIGTNVGGIPEAIVDGETGFVINPENATDLAEKMILLLDNRDLAESMGRRGREMVCDIFDIKKQTKNWKVFTTISCFDADAPLSS